MFSSTFIRDLLDVGLSVVRGLILPWLTERYGSDWKRVEEEVMQVTEPIFAELAAAAAEQGLLGVLLGHVLPGNATLAENLWELRRPYDAKATAALAKLGLVRRTP